MLVVGAPLTIGSTTYRGVFPEFVIAWLHGWLVENLLGTDPSSPYRHRLNQTSVPEECIANSEVFIAVSGSAMR